MTTKRPPSGARKVVKKAGEPRKKAAPKRRGLPPQTVEGALRSFARQFIDLSAEDVDHARRSRDFVIGRLSALKTSTDVPRLAGPIYPFGSFARHTKIQPLDDIDLLVSVRSNDLTVNRTVQAHHVTLTPRAGTWPAAYLTSEGHLNSRKVLNGLKAHVTGIPQYRNSVKRSTKEAVVLQPTTKPWVFDLVPAIAVRNASGTIMYYLIPNGLGGWKPTDPRLDASNTRKVSQAVKGEMYATIRLVKYWNQRGGKPRLGSYHLETMAMSGLQQRWFLGADPLDMLEAAFSYISQRVLSEHPDPKQLLGSLDAHLTLTNRRKIAQAARKAAEEVRAAKHARQTPRKARDHLRKVFGPKFPAWVARAEA